MDHFSNHTVARASLEGSAGEQGIVGCGDDAFGVSCVDDFLYSRIHTIERRIYDGQKDHGQCYEDHEFNQGESFWRMAIDGEMVHVFGLACRCPNEAVGGGLLQDFAFHPALNPPVPHMFGVSVKSPPLGKLATRDVLAGDRAGGGV